MSVKGLIRRENEGVRLTRICEIRRKTFFCSRSVVLVVAALEQVHDFACLGVTAWAFATLSFLLHPAIL